MRAAVRPGFTAIQTAHESTNFYSGIDLIGIRRVSRQADEACSKAHLHPLWLLRFRQPAPGVTAVVTAIHCRRGGTQVHNLGILRMKQERPDHHAEVRKIQLLPMVTAVGATIRPVIGTGVNHLRVLRMDSNGPDFITLWQTVGQRLPVVIPHSAAEETAGVLRTTRCCPVCGASVDVRCGVCHSVSPSASITILQLVLLHGSMLAALTLSSWYNCGVARVRTPSYEVREKVTPCEARDAPTRSGW